MSAIEAALFFAGLCIGLAAAFSVVKSIMYRIMGWED
jgi:hypothetical protein